MIGRPTWIFSGGAAWEVKFESTSGGLKPLFQGFSSGVWNLQSIEVENTGIVSIYVIIIDIVLSQRTKGRNLQVNSYPGLFPRRFEIL